MGWNNYEKIVIFKLLKKGGWIIILLVHPSFLCVFKINQIPNLINKLKERVTRFPNIEKFQKPKSYK